MTFDPAALFILVATSICVLSAGFALAVLALCLKLYTEILKDHRLHDDRKP